MCPPGLRPSARRRNVRLFVGVNRILLGRSFAVAEIPFPGGDFADGQILESDQPPVHVHDLERPLGVDGFAELRLQRHQLERAQLIGVAIHRVMAREVPEAVVGAAGIHVIIINHRPAKGR